MKKLYTLIAAMAITGSAYAQPLTENFDDISQLVDWYAQNNSQPIGLAGEGGWGQPGGTPPFNAFNGVANAYVYANYQAGSGVSTLSNWMFMPARYLQNGDVLTFRTRKAAPDAFADRLEVRLSTNGNAMNVGATATSVGDYTTVLLTINPTLITGVYPTTWTQYTVTISGLAQPTVGRIAFRYFVTNGGPSGANSDYIGIDNVVYTPVSAPTNDNCAGATSLTHGVNCTPVNGNIGGATNSGITACSGTSEDDVWFSFVATTPGAHIQVDGATGMDAVVQVFSGSCGTLVNMTCQDATFDGGVEDIYLPNLTVGQTYYIRVHDYFNYVPNNTAFTICVEQYTPCSLTAPGGAITETELCGADQNGGCLMPTPAYQSLNCGQTVFGNGYATNGNRDTDWYSFALNQTGNVSFSVQAEFPVELFFVNISNCATPTVLASTTGAPCGTVTLNFNFTTAGTYAVVVAPSTYDGYPCGTFNDYIGTLTLPTTIPGATAGGATSFCPGGNVTLNGTGTGTYQWNLNGTPISGATAASYSANAAGSYTLALTNSNGCVGFSGSIPVTILPLDNAVFTYASNTICTGSANSTPTVSVPGSFGASPAGLNFVSTTTGEVDMTTSVAGSYTVTYTTTGTCPNSSTQTINITNSPDATFSYSAAAYCGNGTNPLPVFGGGASSGTFSSTGGLSIDAGTGELNLAASAPGNYTVTNTIAASGACPQVTANFAVEVYAIPTAVVSGGGNVCNDGISTAPVTITLTGNGPWDFAYSDGVSPFTVNGHATNTYSIAAGTGSFTMTSVSDNNCSGTVSGSATINVISLPTAVINGGGSACVGETVDVTVQLTGSAPWNFVITDGTNTFPVTGENSATHIFSATAAGIYTLVNVSDANCTGTVSGASIVSFNALPTVALSSQGTTCVNYAPIVLTGGTPAGGVYSGPAVTSGEFNPAGAGVGTFSITYTFIDGNGCINSVSQNIVVDACLSVEEIGSTIANLYPNPAADYVIIEGSSSIQSISIMDLSGKLISNQAFNALNATLDLSTVASGIYFIEVITANGDHAVRKLVVNK